MKFCTTINCMDGRVQLPVITYLQNRFNVEYVDSITAAGPNRILADGDAAAYTPAILERIHISVAKHGSVGIAVVGHHDCAGNPTPAAEQATHTEQAIKFLQTHYPDLPIIGLWVDENWHVHELELTPCSAS